MSTIIREGRKTCRGCSRPLDNGEPLTDATVEITDRWSRNTVGFVRVPVAPHHIPAAYHDLCYRRSLHDHAASQLRYWQEQIAEWQDDGFPIPESWTQRLTEAQAALTNLGPRP